MKKLKTVYDVADMAEYFNLSVPAINHHIFETGLLQGELLGKGKLRVFSLDEVRAFAHNRRIIHPGRGKWERTDLASETFQQTE